MDPRPTPGQPGYFDPHAVDYDEPTFGHQEPTYADVPATTGPRSGYAPLGTQAAAAYQELELSADEPMYSDAAGVGVGGLPDRTAVTSNPAYGAVDGHYAGAATLRSELDYDQPTFTGSAMSPVRAESFDRPTFARDDSTESGYANPTFMRLPRAQVRAVELYAGLVPAAPMRRERLPACMLAACPSPISVLGSASQDNAPAATSDRSSR